MSNSHATIDFETYSEAGFDGFNAPKRGKKGIGGVGAYMYSMHSSTKVLLLSYLLPGETQIRLWVFGMAPPQELFDHIAQGGLIEAHNSIFEYWVWNNSTNWPELPLNQTRDSAALALNFGLPAAMGNISQTGMLSSGKMESGTKLIGLFSVPKRGKRGTAEQFGEFAAYNMNDVRVEDEISGKCPPLSDYELEVQQLDQVINNRGVHIDRQGMEDCIWVVEQMEKRGIAELSKLTGDKVDSVNKTKALGEWIESFGMGLPRTKKGSISLTKDVVAEKLKIPGLHPKIKRALEIRRDLGLTSVKKLFTMRQMLSDDSRIRGIFRYYGANNTGRWAGSGVQPQNLTRPDKVAKMEENFQVFGYRNPATLTDNSLSDVSKSLRGLFSASPGHDLICSDYSAIEAVVLAELAGEKWRQEVFRTHGKIYEMSASKITGMPFEDFAKHKEEHNGEHHPYRGSIGKVAELACLASDTQVLTDLGWVKITDVTIEHKVFDGIDFVKHDGVVDKGVKDVVKWHGVTATPNHKFYAGGKLWATTEGLNQSTLDQRRVMNTASSLLCKSIANPQVGWSQSQLDALVEGFKNKIGTISETVNPQDVISALKKLLVELQNIIRASRINVYVDGCSTGCALQLEDALIKNIRSTIRMVAGASLFTKSGLMTDTNGLRICLRSLDMILGQIQLTVSTMTEDTNRGTSDSCHTKNSNQTSVKLSGSRTEIKNTVYMSFMSSLHQTLLTLTLLATDSEKVKLQKKSSKPQKTEVYDIINAGPRSRFMIRTEAGPVIAHNSGYGGWIGAWKAFGADKHFKNDDEIKEKIIAWRDQSPAIVEFWGGQFRKSPHGWFFEEERFGVEGAVVDAIENPDKLIHINQYLSCIYDTSLDVLNMILPSGRKLYYQQPRLKTVAHRYAPLDVKEISYMQWEHQKRWYREVTYSGKLTENIVQAVSRDLLADAMLKVEAAGYSVVMHVHDEIISEVPMNFGSVAEFERIMEDSPDWAKDWPIRASGGWRGKRYRK